MTCWRADSVIGRGSPSGSRENSSKLAFLDQVLSLVVEGVFGERFRCICICKVNRRLCVVAKEVVVFVSVHYVARGL